MPGLRSVDCVMRRQEATSRKEGRAGERIALHEAISCICLGVGNPLWVPSESHLGDRVTRAIICSKIMAGGIAASVRYLPWGRDDALRRHCRDRPGRGPYGQERVARDGDYKTFGAGPYSVVRPAADHDFRSSPIGDPGTGYRSAVWRAVCADSIAEWEGAGG